MRQMEDFIMTAFEMSHTQGNITERLTRLIFTLLVFVAFLFFNVSTSVEAGTITTGNTAGLDAGLNPGPEATFGVGIDGIIFDDANKNAIVLVETNSQDKTLEGANPTKPNAARDAFFTSIHNLAGILVINNSVIDSQGYLPNYTNVLNDLNASITGGQGLLLTVVAPAVMSYIEVAGGTRHRDTGSVVSSMAFFDEQNLITFHGGLSTPVDDNGNSGLSIKNVRFQNSLLEFEFTTPFNSMGTGSDGVVNPFIGNYHDENYLVVYNDITGNDFTDLTVTLKASIPSANIGNMAKIFMAGGGILGLRSVRRSAEIGTINGNVFQNISVETKSDNADNGPYIEGGGIVGINAVSSPDNFKGKASLDELKDNLFTNIEVISKDILIGGGVIGLNNNSQYHVSSTDTSEVILNVVSGNIFGNGQDYNIKVQTNYSLRGGGVIGLNGLSNAVLRLNTVTQNVFAGINIDSGSYLRGGGVIGLQNNDENEKGYDPGVVQNVGTFIGTVNENIFLNIQVLAGSRGSGTSGGNLEGGGIIGDRSNLGYTEIGIISNNIFRHVTIVTYRTTGSLDVDAKNLGDLKGGGIVGASSQTGSFVGFLENNYFENSKITVAGGLFGGGVFGAQSSNRVLRPLNGAQIDELNSNYFINSDITVTGPDGIHGGGIAGVSSTHKGDFQQNAVVTVAVALSTNFNIFYNNQVKAENEGNGFGMVTGGGILGFASTGAKNNVYGDARVEEMIGNHYELNNIYVNAIRGGGIVGTYSNQGISMINLISGDANNTTSIFINNTVRAKTFIDGGGLVGINAANSLSTDTVLPGFNRIENTTFTGNHVTAENGQILGGAIYSYGLSPSVDEYISGSVLSNSVFLNNDFHSSFKGTANPYETITQVNFGPKVYGTVAINTGLERTDPDYEALPVTLIIEATSGHQTNFSGNLIEEIDSDNSSNNRTKYNSIYMGSMFGVKVVFDEQQGHEFDPAILHVVDGYTKSNANLVIDAKAGGSIWLLDPIHVQQVDLTDPSDPSKGATFQMDINGNGGRFYWGGGLDDDGLDHSGTNRNYNNSFLAGDTINDQIGENQINFHPYSWTYLLPDMQLDASRHDLSLASLGFLQIRGWMPNISDPDDAYKPNILNLQSATFNGEIHFLINGNYKNDFDKPLLIIETTEDDSIIFENSIWTAKYEIVPGALSVGDEFYLIKTNDKNRIAKPTSGDYTSPSNRDVYINRSALIDDHYIADTRANLITTHNVIDSEVGGNQYQMYGVIHYIGPDVAKPAIVITHAYGAGTAHAALIGTWLPDHSYQQADLNIKQDDTWAIFGGIDGSRFSVADDSRVDLAGVTALIGVARKSTHDAGSFLFGAFIEGGFFDYDVDGIIIPGDTVVGGKGKTRTIGIGLMVRETFKNKLRLEASARVGRLYNDFDSQAYFYGQGFKHDYNIDTTYFGGHIGIAYMKMLNDVSSLDFVLRGYWTRVQSTSATFEGGDVVDFDATDSKRIRGGIRYTRQSSENVYWYAGGYYDYEFDHKISAHTQGLLLGAPELKGGTGIFEIGVETHPSKNNENFSFGFGFQGYVGEIRGISGGFRLGYEF
jgi:hypothetical protein